MPCDFPSSPETEYRVAPRASLLSPAACALPRVSQAQLSQDMGRASLKAPRSPDLWVELRRLCLRRLRRCQAQGPVALQEAAECTLPELRWEETANESPVCCGGSAEKGGGGLLLRDSGRMSPGSGGARGLRSAWQRGVGVEVGSSCENGAGEWASPSPWGPGGWPGIGSPSAADAVI